MIAMAAQQSLPTTVQKSSGSCSPNFANVTGNVKVICPPRFDPQAVRNWLKQAKEQKLTLQETVRLVNEQAAKYEEQEAQIKQLKTQAKEQEGEIKEDKATIGGINADSETSKL